MVVIVYFVAFFVVLNCLLFYESKHFERVKQDFNQFEIIGTDIDECAEGTHNCTGTCVNAVGTFRCVDRESVSCGLGFRYDPETKDCQGKQRNNLI